ncbi:MAG: hypothetical protein ACI9FJ_002510, partial [Alteromonadaceae bacterium]
RVKGDSIIKLQQLAQTENNWSHAYGKGLKLSALKQAIRELVITSEKRVEQFDFRHIQSIGHSKSFMATNKASCASRYHDALHWGRSLYEGDNLKFTTEQDFDDNRDHILSEGTLTGKFIEVQYYDWCNRYNWANTGGSHHAAALLYQIIDQKRHLNCPANITSFHLNAKAMKDVQNDFHLIVATDRCKKAQECFYLTLFLTEMQIQFSSLPFPGYHTGLLLFAIPKKQRRGIDAPLSLWIGEQKQHHHLIDFCDLVTQPQHFF